MLLSAMLGHLSWRNATGHIPASGWHFFATRRHAAPTNYVADLALLPLFDGGVALLCDGLSDTLLAIGGGSPWILLLGGIGVVPGLGSDACG
jgi:hypothetical protein